MNRRRLRALEEELGLPREFEIGLWIAGIVCSPFGAGLVLWRALSPARRIAETLALPFDPWPVIQGIWPVAALVGLTTAVTVRLFLRRLLIRTLAPAME